MNWEKTFAAIMCLSAIAIMCGLICGVVFVNDPVSEITSNNGNTYPTIPGGSEEGMTMAKGDSNDPYTSFSGYIATFANGRTDVYVAYGSQLRIESSSANVQIISGMDGSTDGLQITSGIFPNINGVVYGNGYFTIEYNAHSSTKVLTVHIVDSIGDGTFTNPYTLWSRTIEHTDQELSGKYVKTGSYLRILGYSDGSTTYNVDSFIGGNTGGGMSLTNGDLYGTITTDIVTVTISEDDAGAISYHDFTFYVIPDVAKSGQCGDNLNWAIDDDAQLTITGTGAMYDYRPIPQRAAPWRPFGPFIQSIVLSNGITNIGTYAFLYCGAFTSITIPNTVTIIGEGAFIQCALSQPITIPDSVTSIGDSAFSGAFTSEHSISLVLPDSLTTIGNGAFENNRGIDSELIIPSTVTSIGERAFQATAIPSVVFYGNSCTLGDNSFDIGYDSNVLLDVYTHDNWGQTAFMVNVLGEDTQATFYYLYHTTYDTNGSTEFEYQKQGASYTLPNRTPPVHYSFEGWFTAASGGLKVGDGGDSYSPTADATLYAQFQGILYTVTYVTPNQANTTDSVRYPGTVTLPSRERTGYTFLGWYDGE